MMNFGELMFCFDFSRLESEQRQLEEQVLRQTTATKMSNLDKSNQVSGWSLIAKFKFSLCRRKWIAQST